MPEAGESCWVGRSNRSSTRVTFSRAAVASLLCSTAIAVASEVVHRARPTSAPSTRPTTAEEQLEQRFSEFVLEQGSLRQAVEVLRERTGANIFVNWTAIRAAGVDPDKLLELDLNLRDVTLRQVIDKILSTIGSPPLGAAAYAGLACGARDDIITISTRDNLGPDPPVMRMYDVDELLRTSGRVLELGGAERKKPRVPRAATAAETPHERGETLMD